MSTTILTTAPTIVREDTRLSWVFRSGRHYKLAWNELTATERKDLLEAERRDYFNSLFNI